MTKQKRTTKSPNPKKISARTQAAINAIVLRNLRRLDITADQRAMIALVLSRNGNH